jgi:tetratricopeptide (TPR) repeat protein
MNPSRQHPSNGASKLTADARVAQGKNDYAQALQLLQRARGIDPNSDILLLELGRVYAMSYDFAAAERCFEQAVAISPSKVNAILTAGHHWMSVRNFEAATRYFEQGLCYEPVSLVVFVRLAEMYDRLRRLPDADAISARALREYPNHEAALLARGKVLRQLRQFEKAELILLQLVSNPAYPREARAAGGYELAAVLDAQGCYDEAMESAMEAKALLRDESIGHLKTFREKQAHLKQLTSAINGKMVERWIQTGRSDLQPSRNIALLCGYPRSGTTLLEYVVDAHPDVVSLDETAIFQNKTYFEISRNLSPSTPYSSILEGMTPRTLRQIRTEYFKGVESYLGQPVGNRLVLDKNPGMTFDMPAVKRVFPESKFLVALRDPRDVCLSCFMQAWPVLPDTLPWLSPEGSVENYIAVMGLWLAMKPALGSSAMEVRYEDLIQNLEKTARSTVNFLGLPWNDRALRFNEIAGEKVVRSPTYAEVAKPVHNKAMGRWRNYQKYFEPHFAKLEPFFKAFGYTAVAFCCLVRNVGVLMMFWLLMGLSVLRVSGGDADCKTAGRRSAHSNRRGALRNDLVRAARRSTCWPA